MISLAIFGGSHVDGRMLQPGERVFALALFGGSKIDLTDAPEDVGVTIVTMFGGARIVVRADQDVILDGVSIFGARTLEPRRALSPREERLPPKRNIHDDEWPIDIFAYSIFGGVAVARYA